ncbi:MAG: DNA repair protein RecN, partial [Planctomycetes bacterium]|nr:DNA repair protein RecN [Planctomycetota bacterium]
HQWMQLEERYRRRGDELIDYLEEARGELRDAAAGADLLPALEEELRRGLADLGARAGALRAKRRAAASKLERAVAPDLADLALANACLEARLAPLEPDEGWHGFDDAGADRLEIYFGPNPGEPARPLRDTASGGELSRVMLSLKRALARAEGVPILVFDEIDAGVGGRLGAELGRKMREIGATHQVLCVTHLPQIASFAERHFRVAKSSAKGRTRTTIEPVDGERRVDEIAAMIRGKERTRTSLTEAREMLAHAGAGKPARD